jgi:hypothetical protein
LILDLSRGLILRLVIDLRGTLQYDSSTMLAKKRLDDRNKQVGIPES